MNIKIIDGGLDKCLECEHKQTGETESKIGECHSYFFCINKDCPKFKYPHFDNEEEIHNYFFED